MTFRRASLSVLLAAALACLTGTAAGVVKAQVSYPYVIVDLGDIGENSAVFARDINDRGQVILSQRKPSFDGFDAFMNDDGAITPLGDLGGGASDAFAINELGYIAGTSKNAQGFTRGFLRTTAGAIIDIGALDGRNSTVRGLNNLNQIIGDTALPSTQRVGYFWDDGLMVDLGGVNGGNSVLPRALNNLGQVVGSGSDVAFVWHEGTMTALPTLGGISGFATDITDGGIIVGGSQLPSGKYEATAWVNGVPASLDTLGAGTSFSQADFVNEGGQAIGIYNPPIASGGIFPFVFGNGVMLPMTALGQAYNGYLRAINNAGQAVGYFSFTPNASGTEPFLFENGTVRYLSTLVDPGLGWLFLEPVDINNAGQIIGLGFRNGSVRAFLMNPVAPNNTPPGTNVVTTPVDETGGTTPVTISFGEVVSGGETTLVTTPTGPPPPSGFKIGQPPVYYNLETTAVFSGSATLCINYSGIAYGNQSNLKLFHYEDNQWVDRTTSVDTSANIICATVTSFSPFALFEKAYAFTGFFQPVDNGGVFNSVKAGASVPVKFSLGGDQGLVIMAANSPRSVPVACDTGAPVDAVEETVTAGSSSLSYDPATGQYRYVWKTEKGWTGCRQLTVALNDGTSYTASFKLIK